MRQVGTPLPVKLVISVFGHRELFGEVERRLTAQYGATDWRSALLPFDHTRYYEPEFGSGLKRRVFSFASLIDPGKLPDIKLWTNDLEQYWVCGGNRRVNLDPGYISAAKLVLATTKNYGHRVYLQRGIYAEVTLSYRDKAFRASPWTYPDYGSPSYLEMMHEIRRLYMAQIKDRGLLGPTRRSG